MCFALGLYLLVPTLISEINDIERNLMIFQEIIETDNLLFA